MQEKIGSVIEEAFNKHKSMWTGLEKKLVHEMLNKYRVNDGVDEDDLAVTSLMCMIYVDGIRIGASLR
jgi:hypothetical protein